jgi:hypothetical protein
VVACLDTDADDSVRLIMSSPGVLIAKISFLTAATGMTFLWNRCGIGDVLHIFIF